MSAAVDDTEVRELDARLALGAAAAWLATVVGVGAGAGPVLATALACALAGTLLLAVAGVRTGRVGATTWVRAAPALALMVFCVALVLLPLSARLGHARAGPLYRLAAQHAAVTAELTVTADPRVLAATGPGGTARVAVESGADAVWVRGQKVPAGGSVVVLAAAGPWRDVLPGQQVRVDGSLQPDLEGGALSVTLFARSSPDLLGRPPWYQRLAGRIRSSLRAAVTVLPDQERGLLPGLVDGDTSGLDPVLAERFRLAGLTHLVAVSGTNCSLVIGAVLLVLRRARARPWVSALVGGAVLLLFVVVARPSPSVLRAALMAGVALLALVSGRPRAALPALSAVVLGLLLWDPTLAVSASFAMSVLATAALLVLAPGWAAALRRRRVPAGVAESIAVAAAAHVVTAPVVAAISGRVSVVAIAANVLAEPVVAVTTILGFAAAVLAPVALPAGQVLAWTAGWPCRWLVGVADFFGGLHGATVPWPGGARGGLALLLVVAVVLAAASRLGARRVLAAAGLTAVVILIPVRAATSGWPPTGWVFAACDVGQGDALLLAAGPGAAVEIDTGPDPVAIDRCLRDFGISSVPLLVITHFHLDHVGGLAGVLRGRHVGRIVAGPLDEPLSGLDLVRHDLGSRTMPTAPADGTGFDVGAVHLDVLGPAAPFHGTRSDPNNSSLVLRATVAGVRILLPGDAEIEAQQALLHSGVDLRADVLKVPHHGSAYSDPVFLAAAHASVAVVSVGLHNDYGHPSPVLLTEMARLGVPLARTDHDGDVAVARVGGHLTAIVHGTAASTVGLGRPVVDRDEIPPGGAPVPPEPRVEPAGTVTVARALHTGTPTGVPTAWSVPDARLAACPGSPSASINYPTPCRAPSCWSATRICSSSGPSARSPPPPAGPIRPWR